MVAALAVMTALLAILVRQHAPLRRWAFRLAFPLTVLANLVAVFIGSFVVVLAKQGLLLRNMLGELVPWHTFFLCIPLSATVNLVALAWPWRRASLDVHRAAMLANGVLAVYGLWNWHTHEASSNVPGAPPTGAVLVLLLAAGSLATLAWDTGYTDESHPVERQRSSSWRTICVLLAVVAVGPPLTSVLHSIYRQRKTVAALEQLGCRIKYDYATPPLDWVESSSRAAEPYVCDVWCVVAPSARLNAEQCELLARRLSELPTLLELRFSNVPPTDRHWLQPLAHGTRLRTLRLHGPGVDDEMMADVAAIGRLAFADFSDSPITDAGLARLAKLTQLQWLNLRGTRVSGKGLKHFQSLGSLTRLNLAETQLGDAELAELRQVKGLIELDVSGTHVTADAITAFEQALPNCKIMNERRN